MAIIVVGIFSSLAEGIGISLFLPFLDSMTGTPGEMEPGDGLLRDLGHLFAGVPPEQRLVIIGACIFAAILIRALLAYGYGVLSDWLSNYVGHRLRSELFAQVLSLSFRYMQGSNAGSLWNTLTTETWRTGKALSVVINIAITFCTLGVYLVLLLLLSWPLTLLVCGFMAAVSWLVLRLTRRVEHLGREATRTNEALAHRMVEGFAGLRIIRAFGREGYEQARFDAASMRVSRTFLRLSVVSGLVGPIYEVLSAALLVAISIGTLRGMGDLPSLLVFVFVLYRVQPKIKTLDSARVELISLAPAVVQVLDLLGRRGKPYVRSGSRPVPALRRGIAFREVTFRYAPNAEPALHDVSFTVPAGRMTALVGPSGAGKSTIVNLLLRFYDPDSGAVEVDGEPLPRFDLDAWRRRIAIVSQDVYLFTASVRDNIAYGRPDASEADIVAAARQADAHDFIERLPEGYDTILGEGGVRLSGGQQQRITLARAIVRDPEILILDEATNSLDSISEHVIRTTLDVMSEGRTILVIAHRLATIERADQIVVLENGQVRECGGAEVLLERDGLFARLYRLQQAHPV